MSSIAQVSEAMQHVLTKRAKDLERETGFVERSTAQLDWPTPSLMLTTRRGILEV